MSFTQRDEAIMSWLAQVGHAIAGKMGEPIEGGFILDQPNIQTFERKPKEPKTKATTA
jgi:hypothetical protein